MLDRDGLSVDERLRAHLERSGARVSVAPGRGYGAMMAQPHEAVPPYGVFNRVFSWLREEDASEPARGIPAGPAGIPDAEPGGGPAGGIPAGPAGIAGAEPGGGPGGGYSVRASAPSAGETIELGVDGVSIRETPMTVAWPTGDLFGILAEPVDVPPAALSVVLLNAGAIRRIGPNRMWVEAARRWAAQGVHSLRLDLEGIGDAEGDPHRLTELAALYTPELVDQVCAALDELEHRGMGHRFVLAGLCSGAYWSFHAALRDERVAAAFMLNPQALFWDESLEASRALRRGVLRSSSWRKLVRGQVPLERMRDLAYRAPVALPRRALARRSARRRGENELEDAFDRLRDAGKPLRFIFSGNEPLCEELELEGYLARLDRWPNASVEFIPGQIHTLRPLQSQQGAHQALDRALAGMLEEAELKTSPASGA
jgi:hypothetical protein